MDKMLNDLNKRFQKKPKETPAIVVDGVLQGRLFKKGAKAPANFLIETTWKRRWFKETEPGKLGYFEDQDFKKMKGTIDLTAVTQISIVTSPLFGFLLVTPNRTYVLRANTHAERMEWVTQLSSRCPGAVVSDDRTVNTSDGTETRKSNDTQKTQDSHVQSSGDDNSSVTTAASVSTAENKSEEPVNPVSQRVMPSAVDSHSQTTSLSTTPQNSKILESHPLFESVGPPPAEPLPLPPQQK